MTFKGNWTHKEDETRKQCIKGIPIKGGGRGNYINGKMDISWGEGGENEDT